MRSVRTLNILKYFAISLAIAMGGLVNSSRSQPFETYELRNMPFLFRCGDLGQACCLPPAANLPPSLTPLVSCSTELGCDLTTNRCVQPCGGNDQVCCVGPETRAPKWTSDGRVYSPNWFGMREMCDAGACDRATHRCFACGMRDGAPCCPPDAAQATARCIGQNFECRHHEGTFYESGTCIECGRRFKPPCEWGCDSGLELRQGLCDVCGAELQPPCDRGCNAGLAVAQGRCMRCGAAGQIPCDSGCRHPFKLQNGLCAACGENGQAPCDTGCVYGTTQIAGVCRHCGGEGQVPCEGRCNYPMKIAQGVCRLCGAAGQIPCATGCNHGLVVSNGLCVTPSQPPDVCAAIGEACVPDHQPGMHCCRQASPPGLCVYGQCRVCVRHGEQCLAGGSQICCDAVHGDMCVLDPATDTVVCDIPD